eukprot:scaffold88380_cov68-Phaeocystis_antarctica.AAC.2
MPQPSANANRAGASNGGLTQRALHNQPKAQRDGGAEPARLRMVCGELRLGLGVRVRAGRGRG